MIDARRSPLYDYVYSLFHGRVTDYIYPIEMPSNLTEEDANGFMVIRMADVRDRSEFKLKAYAEVRVTIEMYTKAKDRGRLDKPQYEKYEDLITQVLNEEDAKSNPNYEIDMDSILSTDDIYNDDKNNIFYIYFVSFVIKIK